MWLPVVVAESKDGIFCWQWEETCSDGAKRAPCGDVVTADKMGRLRRKGQLVDLALFGRPRLETQLCGQARLAVLAAGAMLLWLL